MHPATSAALSSFALDPWLLSALVVTALVYVRGWRALRLQMPERFTPARLAAFLGGLATIFAATASPLDAFASLLLTVHMIQHLLLTMVAAPLLLLGAPQIPLLRGLPAGFVRGVLGPFLAAPELRTLGRTLAHPLVGLIAFVLATWLWHVPALYELALRSDRWHALEHASFLGTALLFWWPVVAPWPSVAVWPRWALLPCLLAADLANTALSALLSFSESVIYPTYAAAPRLGSASALEDQSAAGAIMWVLGSLGYLVPAALIAIRLLSPPLARVGGHPRAARADDRIAAERTRRGPLDLLALPGIGALLRRPGFPRALRMVSFALAALIVADGLLGPSMSPMNLAGVLPWTYWRGLLVVTLLAAGNWFCTACPFLLPRDLGRRFLPARLRWPRALRSKWLAAALVVAYLCVYEATDPWDSPAFTACIVLGYFAAAFAVDGLFRGASFCKYVCPIGQFNFVTATLAPFEVRVRAADVCATCTTHDCIRGNDGHRGCQLDLYLPQKRGNLDCTFCLDCVHACPHDNVGVLAVVPGADLARDPWRSSLGRLSARPDVATLALVLVFGALANAAAMAAPVVAGQRALARGLGVAEDPPLLVMVLLLALLALPVGVALACAAAGRTLAGARAGLRELFCRFSLALVPLGAGMWAAHLLFHLVTGGTSLLPVAQRAARDAGASFLGTPSWSMSAPGELPWLLPLLVLVLDLGLLLTLWLLWRIAASYVGRARRERALLAPWGGVACALWAAAIWILLQPMEMRGTMVH